MRPELKFYLFDDPESNQPTQQFPLERINDSLWNIYIEGIGEGQHYGYIAWGPNWEYDENWLLVVLMDLLPMWTMKEIDSNPNKLLFDPYALALHRDHDWFKGSTASGPKTQ